LDICHISVNVDGVIIVEFLYAMKVTRKGFTIVQEKKDILGGMLLVRGIDTKLKNGEKLRLKLVQQAGKNTSHRGEFMEIKRKRYKVYIASAIQDKNAAVVVKNLAYNVKAGAAIWAIGHYPYSPALNCHFVAASNFDRISRDYFRYDDYFLLDFAYLMVSDILYIPNRDHITSSKGTGIKYDAFLRLKRPIIYSARELPDMSIHRGESGSINEQVNMMVSEQLQLHGTDFLDPDVVKLSNALRVLKKAGVTIDEIVKMSQSYQINMEDRDGTRS
jgi:hypothetical protein